MGTSRPAWQRIIPARTALDRRARRIAVLALMAVSQAAQAFTYDPSYCATVVGTMNINWNAIAGGAAPCDAVEFTDGTVADAADGSIVMTGTSVSDSSCIGNAAYAFTLSPDTFSLVGGDTLANVPMTLVREPGQQCFAGTWSLGSDVYVGYIWAGAFPLKAFPVPALDARALALLIAGLGCTAAWSLRRRAFTSRQQR